MEIIVRDADIENALLRLKKLMSVDGVLLSLKFRDLYPNLTDRAKAKALRSLAKRKRSERRREARRERERG